MNERFLEIYSDCLDKVIDIFHDYPEYARQSARSLGKHFYMGVESRVQKELLESIQGIDYSRESAGSLSLQVFFYINFPI